MSWAVWITGLPGSGKSVIARAVAEKLRSRGDDVIVLELDAIRRIITPAPTYSDAEREAVYRALVYIGAVLVDAGIPVIFDATAPRRGGCRTSPRCSSSVRWRSVASVKRSGPVERRHPLSMRGRRGRVPGSPASTSSTSSPQRPSSRSTRRCTAWRWPPPPSST